MRPYWIMGTVLLLLLVLPVVVAQQAYATLNKTEFTLGETVIISGKATPGTEITVQIWDPEGNLVDQRKTTVASDGTFSVEVPLPPTLPYSLWKYYGTYTVVVYEGANEIATLSFELKPLAGVKGVVVDENGSPVAGAEVEVIGTAIKTYTDANGVFVVSLEPGNYTLKIYKPNYKSVTVNVSVTEVGKTVDVGKVALMSYDYLISRLESQVSSLSEAVNKITATVSELEKAVRNVVDTVTLLKENVTGLAGSVTDISKAVSSLEESLSKVMEATEKLSKSLDEVKKALEGKAAIEDVEALKSTLNSLAGKVSTLAKSLDELKKTVSDLEDKLGSLSKRVDTLEAATKTISDLQNTIKNLQSVTSDLKKSVDQLSALSKRVDEVSSAVSGASNLALVGVIVAVIGLIIAIVAVVLVMRRIVG